MIIDFPKNSDYTLRICVYSLVVTCLRQNDYNKTQTARVLDISLRGLRNIVREMNKKGWLEGMADRNKIVLLRRY